MLDQYLFTAIFAVSGMLGILSLILWLEKMIRIIMANYFIASIMLAFSNTIDLLTSQLLTWTIERRVDGLQQRLGKLLVAWKPTLLLSIYFILLIFLVTKSRISLWNVKHEAIKRLLTAIFLPCTIMSILFSIALAIFGNQMVSLDGLRTIAYNVSMIPHAYNLILLTPIRIILPGIVTILTAVLVLRSPEDIAWKDIVIELEKN